MRGTRTAQGPGLSEARKVCEDRPGEPCGPCGPTLYARAEMALEAMRKTNSVLAGIHHRIRPMPSDQNDKSVDPGGLEGLLDACQCEAVRGVRLAEELAEQIGG